MIQSNIEWKIESAWITALGLNTDLTGVPVRRFMDATLPLPDEDLYPVITVHCSGSLQPPFAGTIGYDECFIELSASTYRIDDKSGKACADLLGAIRDTVRDINLLPFLNREAGLTVYGINLDDPSSIEDTDKVRHRSLTVRCSATASDIPDNESSSSSQSSSSSDNSNTSVSSSSSSTQALNTSSSSQSTSSSQSSSSSNTSVSSTSESSANTSSSSPSSSQSSTSESSG